VAVSIGSVDISCRLLGFLIVRIDTHVVALAFSGTPQGRHESRPTNPSRTSYADKGAAGGWNGLLESRLIYIIIFILICLNL
jgi:hypothetical protein